MEKRILEEWHIRFFFLSFYISIKIKLLFFFQIRQLRCKQGVQGPRRVWLVHRERNLSAPILSQIYWRKVLKMLHYCLKLEIKKIEFQEDEKLFTDLKAQLSTRKLSFLDAITPVWALKIPYFRFSKDFRNKFYYYFLEIESKAFWNHYSRSKTSLKNNWKKGKKLNKWVACFQWIH